MLTLLIWGAASMNAQVTIGSENPPHSGAVLDLQSTTQGLKLPNVALASDLTKFVLPLTDPSTKEDAKGMYVYNTNSTVGEGVYVWDGYQWILVKESYGAKPVQQISVVPLSGPNYVGKNTELELSAIITPIDASNSKIVWSADRGTTAGSVTVSGIASASSSGLFTVRATANNGVIGSQTIAVLQSDMVINQSLNGKNEYKSYDFNGTEWMIQNSKEGTSTYQTFDNNVQSDAFYYTWGQAHAAAESDRPCQGDWRLPTVSEILALRAYLQTDGQRVELEKVLWLNTENLSGYYGYGDWHNYRNEIRLPYDYGYISWNKTFAPFTTSIDYVIATPVRCVKIK
ncbi:hypothetical protein FACS189440_12330 [Bacteroidia bacterium]|nr:hypothetical protein FACS189423_11060 [Bacteroidia bacterium]GHT48511.1 hypothetical protein FACS189440_12330 [Bacteroidia bacterium]